MRCRLVLVVVALLLAGCGARTGLPVSTDSGHTRTGTGVVLFGGADATAQLTLGDTWTWDGRTWTQHEVTGPSPRADAAIATLDDGTVVLFGGVDALGTPQAAPLGDTWTWDGAAWTRHDVPGPPPRWGAAAASLNGTVVLFGGTNRETTFRNYFADTWLWDGANWTQANVSGPAARTCPLMATLNSQVVLFGGGGDGFELNDTWTWDGAAWTQLQVTAPPSSDDVIGATLSGCVVGATLGGSVMIYEAEGFTNAPRNETWTWDGTAWTELHVAGPTVHSTGVATFGDTVVLFGGIRPVGGYLSDDLLNETWVMDGATWTQRDVPGPSSRYAPAMSGL
jgi:hypothetical protein